MLAQVTYCKPAFKFAPSYRAPETLADSRPRISSKGFFQASFCAPSSPIFPLPNSRRIVGKFMLVYLPPAHCLVFHLIDQIVRQSIMC